MDIAGADRAVEEFLGTTRIEVTATDPGTAIFVGVARSADAAAYLRGVGHHRVDGFGPLWNGPGVMHGRGGGRPATPPGDADLWVAQSSGEGTQVVDWRPEDGNWTVVVMRADAGAGVDVEARVGATAPGLGAVAAGLLAAGAFLTVAGVLLVVLAVRRAQQGIGGSPAWPTPPPAGPGPGPSEEPAPPTGETAAGSSGGPELPAPRASARETDTTQRS
jgi:hypothetical protein